MRISCLDRDHNGFFSRSELLVSEAIFSAIDRNGDGKVPRRELNAYIDHLPTDAQDSIVMMEDAARAQFLAGVIEGGLRLPWAAARALVPSLPSLPKAFFPFGASPVTVDTLVTFNAALSTGLPR